VCANIQQDGLLTTQIKNKLVGHLLHTPRKRNIDDTTCCCTVPKASWSELQCRLRTNHSSRLYKCCLCNGLHPYGSCTEDSSHLLVLYFLRALKTTAPFCFHCTQCMKWEHNREIGVCQSALTFYHRNCWTQFVEIFTGNLNKKKYSAVWFFFGSV
jgi:hypothetical protein